MVLVALSAAASLNARVGETLEQLESRFGPRFEAGVDELDPSNKIFGFDAEGSCALSQSGFTAYAVIDLHGVCVELSYVKMAGRPIDGGDLEAMLTANCMGMRWTREKNQSGKFIYIRSDGLVGWLARADRFELMTPDRASDRGLCEWDS